jgi:hypothetical protein
MLMNHVNYLRIKSHILQVFDGQFSGGFQKIIGHKVFCFTS